MPNASTQTSLYRAFIPIVVVCIAGCGGGGGGGGGRDSGRASNAPPVLGAAAFSTKLNTDLQGQVSATDPTGDALTFSVAANPGSGTLVSFSPNGAFVYRPAAGFLGDDSFRVQVNDSAGNSVPGVVDINVHPNRAPVAGNDALRADGGALANISVLANDTDADSDPLTVTIEEVPLAGTAAVNTDSSIGISGLPGGFKGVTRFKYRVTDSSSESAIGTAAVFVGVEPFRVVFAGDPAANGSPEIYMGDFASAPTALTTATEGNMRLRGFAASQNGATVVYRREDRTSAATVDLGFVRTAAPIQRGTVPLPAGATLPLEGGNADQFIVSPDGQWIALIARVGSVDSVYVFNAATPAGLTKVSPAGAVFASRLRFSRDSRNLYFLASSVAGGGTKTLYTVTPVGPSPTVAVSAISDPATSEDVLDYSVSADQSSIVIEANRGGRKGLFYIDARQLRVETQVSHPLGFGESIGASTISVTGGTIGGGVGQRVGYTVSTLLSNRAYVAEISATPNPREVATAATVVGLRPDDGALLYAKNDQIYERDLASNGTDTVVAVGATAWYDSTGNIVLVRQAQFAGDTAYTVLGVATRGAFGSTQRIGTPAQAARFSEVSGFDRGVALLAEGAPGGTAPTRARVALVNALAPDRLLYLGDFETPLQLTSSPVVVVAR